MTAYKLCWFLLKAIFKGHGKSPVYFDTDAREFDYHMATVGSAYLEDMQVGEGYWITLHEEER